MHGRLKVRTTEQQQLIKQKEQQKKLSAYKFTLNEVARTRNCKPYDSNSFTLSAQILLLNPDVYTLWNYRKEVTLQEIEQSKTDEIERDDKLVAFLSNEIKLTENCLLNNPKSYSSWHHRYWILQHHPQPNWQHEFNLCTKYLSLDDRNFHCWDYRRLMLNKIGILLHDELKFSTDRINENFSNYSSWHYRSTLRELDDKSANVELDLVKSAIFTDPGDSSAWFYLRWILSHSSISCDQRKDLLENLEKLFEIDPDYKWIIMGKIWLTGSLRMTDKAFKDKRVQYYQLLKEMDSLRKGQYDDYLKIVEVDESGDE